MSTAHNRANLEDVAKVVLMPGDPLRAKLIAENFLENPVLFNDVRGMLGYTGTYKGKRVSVMGSGMGMASMGIYSYELFKFYNVDAIIRVGSTGSYSEKLPMKSVALVKGAYSESTYALAQSGDTATILVMCSIMKKIWNNQKKWWKNTMHFASKWKALPYSTMPRY